MRIGLVAMSGIRACDEELLRLGLTLPGFVERSQVIASLPSLGLLTLAGMTPDEHDLEYIEIPDLAACKEAQQIPDGFDLVAVSSYSAQIDEAYELGDILRERGMPVVIGGPHVTALPEEAALHCDAVVVGEGEPSWPQVLANAEQGKLQSVYGSSDEQFDLADAPMPAFELLDIENYNRLTVQTSRGCPFRCEFCASSVVLTERYKQKPADKVLAEIDRICEIWNHPFIEFADDNSFVNKAYWKDLLPHLKSRNIRWFTETDISVADDPELLEMMHESGCAQVLIGLVHNGVGAEMEDGIDDVIRDVLGDLGLDPGPGLQVQHGNAGLQVFAQGLAGDDGLTVCRSGAEDVAGEKKRRHEQAGGDQRKQSSRCTSSHAGHGVPASDGIGLSSTRHTELEV